MSLPAALQNAFCPKSRPIFKIRPAVVYDKVFKARVMYSMNEWEAVKNFGVPLLSWWEVLVKPGIRKLAITRSKELNKERKGQLNLLMLRQSYLTSKVQSGQVSMLSARKEVKIKIEDMFTAETTSRTR